MLFRLLASTALLAIALAGPAVAFDIKNSATAGNNPALATPGEIAINRADKRLIFKNVDGSLGYGSLLNALPSGRKAVELGDASDLRVQATSGVFARLQSERANDCINVKDQGAVADYNDATGTGTDNRPIFQAAATKAMALGKAICLWSGSYYLSGGFVFDQSGSTAEATPRPSILGSGHGTTRLVFGAGDFKGISYVGGATAAGPHVYARIIGVRLEKADVVGSALDLTRTAFMVLDDVTATGWHIGLNGTDVLSTSIRNSSLIFNHYGAVFARGTFSYPNAISFIDTRIGSNAENGIVATSPTTLSIQGGEVGGNGLNGSTATKGGIYINGGPVEGGVGLVADHVYFENNSGQADILIAATGQPATHVVRGSTFNRLQSTNPVTSMIKAVGTAQVNLEISGNAFKRLGSYGASAARPYIDVSGATNTANVLAFAPSNLMDDPTTEGAGLLSWKAWSPTIAAASGALGGSTITSARYRQTGKTVSWEADFTITTNGSGAGALTMTLPVPFYTGAKHVFGGQSGSGASIAGTTTSGTGTLIFNYAGGYPGADNTRIVLSGTYEAQ